MEDPHFPTSTDHEFLASIDQWIAPPHGDEVRKLFSALGKVSDASPYLTRVKRYVVDGPLRNELGIGLYDATIWGQIRWRRSLGKPESPQLADGFLIEHQYLFWWDAGPGADGTPRTKEKWFRSNQGQLWDGPEDEETLAVNFMLRGVVQRENRVFVDLVTSVEWKPADDPWLTQRRRTIQYPASYPVFTKFPVSKQNAPLDLGVFEVVRAW
jgi:hypothetical protein